jgi:hypothetical protein
MYLVHLESRRAAGLIVPSNGLFTAQVPPGTYMVASVTDDKILLPFRVAFQAAKNGEAYNLGNLAMSYDLSWGLKNLKMTASADPGGAVESGIARMAGGKPVPRHVLTPVRMSSLPPRRNAPGVYSISFRDETEWNAFVASAVSELHANGIDLLPEAAYAGMLPEDQEMAFIRRREAAEQKWASAIAGIESAQCQPDMSPEPCQAAIADAKSRRDAELKAIADERATVALTTDRENRRRELERYWAERIDKTRRHYCLGAEYTDQCKWRMAEVEAERDEAMQVVD